MNNLWAKAAIASSRTITKQERETNVNRQLSLRRVTCKARAHQPQLLAEVYYSALTDSYDDPSSDALVLCLERNSHVSDAVENRLLNAFDEEGDIQQEMRPDIETELLELARKSLPSIDRLYVMATRIRIRTEAASNMAYSVSEEDELVIPFSELPRSITSLRPPIVQIRALKRLGPAGCFGLSAGVDRVVWGEYDGVFAFKRVGRDFNATACEIEFLLHPPLHSDGKCRILNLSAVVVDVRGRLRGFLSPFEPYGSLEEVFTIRQLLPSSSPNRGCDIGSVFYPRKPEWKDKLHWGTQLAHGVATLHDGNAVAGSLTLRNLNPRNVLVSGSASSSSSRDTFLIISGLHGAASPTGMHYSRRWAAPERSYRSSYEIGTALDVANLGMVLWALAEEKFDGFPDIYSGARRESASSTTSRRGGPVPQGRRDLWRKDDPPTPGWYRLLIESCIEEEPARRPKAAEVAAVLERQLQFSRP